MEFASVPQQRLYEEAGRCLRAGFGELVLESPDEPAFFVRLGSVGVRVNVEPAGEDAAILEAYAWLARDLAIDAELGLFLARHNVELQFGSLCVDVEDAVILQHALFEESVSEPVLERLVRLLAHTADTLDAELRAR